METHKYKLNELASIQSGLLLARKEAKSDELGVKQYRRLSLKTLESDGTINVSAIEPFDSTENLSGQMLTEMNDIIVRTFAPINPVIINKETTGLLIPSQLVSIRVENHSVILPEYVQFYLSLRSTQEELTAIEAFVTLRTLKVTTIANLEIIVPTIEDQKKIVALDKTIKTAIALREQLNHESNKLLEGITRQVIKRGKK